MKYALVYAKDPSQFEDKVNDYLFTGWSVHGSPFVDSNDYIHQALIKE